MLTANEIKQKALEYAKEFKERESITFEFNDGSYSTKEWYMIITLACIYHNLMLNVYDREQAIQKQKEAFAFVRENAKLFEDN